MSRRMNGYYIAVHGTREGAHYFILCSPNVAVVVEVDVVAEVLGSRFWPGRGSFALPSWTIVKYSCRSYAAVASFAASVHIHQGHYLDSKD